MTGAAEVESKIGACDGIREVIQLDSRRRACLRPARGCGVDSSVLALRLPPRPRRASLAARLVPATRSVTVRPRMPIPGVG